MIEARNLYKVYKETIALKEFSCKITDASITGLLGANGAGKSTVIKILSACLAPSEGTAIVAGYDILFQAQNVRQKIGYLPETMPLYQDMKAKEYLEYIGALKNIQYSLLQEQISVILEECHIKDVYKKRIENLSRGYRQRLGLAQALLGNPSVLIVDEPTSALDPLQIIETRTLLKKLGKTKSILLSTHILSEVEQICDNVIILHKGEIVFQGNFRNQRMTLEQLYLSSTHTEKVV